MKIYPDKIYGFENKQGRNFYVILPNGTDLDLSIADSHYYKSTQILLCGNHIDTEHSVPFLLEHVVEDGSDVLFIPYQYYKADNVLPASADVNDTKRFLMLGCPPTTSATPEVIQHFLNVVYNTNAAAFVARADEFFVKLGDSRYIRVLDKVYGTEARIPITSNLLFTELCGIAKGGEIGVIPCGEVAITPVQHANRSKTDAIKMDGEIIWHGMTIIHCSSTMNNIPIPEHQQLYRDFSSLKNGAMKLELEDGYITKITALDAHVLPAVKALERLLEQEPRYKAFFELGIGFNTEMDLYDINSAMNESYGGDYRCIHFAVGSAGMDYHFDIICPNTLLIAENGNILAENNAGLRFHQTQNMAIEA